MKRLTVLSPCFDKIEHKSIYHKSIYNCNGTRGFNTMHHNSCLMPATQPMTQICTQHIYTSRMKDYLKIVNL